jgi:hypothetical protein
MNSGPIRQPVALALLAGNPRQGPVTADVTLVRVGTTSRSPVSPSTDPLFRDTFLPGRMRIVDPPFSRLVICVLLAASACMKPVALDAEGFACSQDSECDDATACLAGFCRLRPAPHTTGVPPGTVLSLQPGEQKFTVAGATIDAKDIVGCVTIGASNVTLKRSRITCDGFFGISVNPGVTGTRIEDVEIRSKVTTNALVGFEGSETLLVRMDISGFQVGLSLGTNSSLSQSSIHDLVDNNKGGVLVLGGAHLHFENNVIRRGGTRIGPCIQLHSFDSAVDDVWVESNDLDDCRSLVEVVEKSGGPVTGIHVVNNRLGRGYVDSALEVNGVSSTVDVRGNTFADTGEPYP